MDKGKIRLAISSACGLALAGAMVIASPLYATPAASALTVAARNKTHRKLSQYPERSLR